MDFVFLKGDSDRICSYKSRATLFYIDNHKNIEFFIYDHEIPSRKQGVGINIVQNIDSTISP